MSLPIIKEKRCPNRQCLPISSGLQSDYWDNAGGVKMAIAVAVAGSCLLDVAGFSHNLDCVVLSLLQSIISAGLASQGSREDLTSFRAPIQIFRNCRKQHVDIRRWLDRRMQRICCFDRVERHFCKRDFSIFRIGKERSAGSRRNSNPELS